MPDPLIKEFRQIKETHAAKYGCDLRTMIEDLRRRQQCSGRKLVTTPLRRPPKAA